MGSAGELSRVGSHCSSHAEIEKCGCRSNLSIIDQIGNSYSCNPKRNDIQSERLPYMVFNIRPPLGDVAQFLNRSKVCRSNDDEGSSRMGDEGCPNERQSTDDAGYSKREEEEEANSNACDEVV